MYIEEFKTFPTRTIEERFRVDKLDFVANNFFKYLEATYLEIEELDKEKYYCKDVNYNYDNNVTWRSKNDDQSFLNNLEYMEDDYFLYISNKQDFNYGIYKINRVIFRNEELEKEEKEKGYKNKFDIIVDTSGLYGAISYREKEDIFEAQIIKGEYKKLRDVHFIDLSNNNISYEYYEPYFIIADVSDYADYKYNSITNIDNGIIKSSIYKLSPYRFVCKDIIKERNQHNKDILVIYSSKGDIVLNEGIHKIHTSSVYKLDGSDYCDLWLTEPLNYDEEKTNIIASIIDFRQGNLISNPKKLQGRGSISIQLDTESDKVYYKIIINTIPTFINWSYYIINYLLTGVYDKLPWN